MAGDNTVAYLVHDGPDVDISLAERNIDLIVLQQHPSLGEPFRPHWRQSLVSFLDGGGSAWQQVAPVPSELSVQSIVTVTARRFLAQASSFDAGSTGRSLP